MVIQCFHVLRPVVPNIFKVEAEAKSGFLLAGQNWTSNNSGKKKQ